MYLGEKKNAFAPTQAIFGCDEPHNDNLFCASLFQENVTLFTKNDA